MTQSVTISEVGPRDGLQSVDCVMATDAKKAWIKAEAEAGVSEIEVGSFVPPALLPQMADTAEIVAFAKTIPDLDVVALVPNLKGAERAIACGADKISIPFSMSETHSIKNVRKDHAAMLAEIKAIADLVAQQPEGARPHFEVGLSTAFGCKLRELDAAGQEQICMTGVSRTNQLLLDYHLYSAQRQKARFINTGMMVTLTGAVASDALEDGTVISGVGGQYNFVAMAHDLPGARSVLCIRSTRGVGKQLKSNIVPFYGHITIPKHLRDVIVTEYGVADLRGQSDSEIIKRLINIADSRFQSELLEFAKNHGKVEHDYRIPFEARNNTPARLQEELAPLCNAGLLPAYPFGTELTEQEQALGASLRKIKALSEEPAHFISASFKALLHRGNEEAARPFLERIHLEHPETTRDFLVQQLLMMELEERGALKVS